MSSHIPFILFVFVLGSCIGSFLNVVVWRLPRGESLIHPGSHCPKCGHALAWYDNIPIFAWLALRAKCRYCRAPISARYPVVELITGLLFVLCYVTFFIAHTGPSVLALDSAGQVIQVKQLGDIRDDWWVYAAAVVMISGLLAASLIDAELFIIPIEIPYVIAAAALLLYATQSHPGMAGSVNVGPAGGALSAGAGAGTLITVFLWALGRMPMSFPQGEPLLEVDRKALAEEIKQARRRGEKPPQPELPPEYTPGQIRAEMSKEMLFLSPPLVLGFGCLLLYLTVPAVTARWDVIMKHDWLSGLLGSLLGGMAGAFIVWLTRVVGTLIAGRVAMGLGDVHLMFGVGTVIGAGFTVIAFFLAPFFGLLVAAYKLAARSGRELPYGPYLSLASAAVLLCYGPIAAYLYPQSLGLDYAVQRWFGGASTAVAMLLASSVLWVGVSVALLFGTLAAPSKRA